ncbi:MAG: lysophospholipid acyltransferase family protein [Geitlerinemataceae cyanobacterium]
MTLATTPTRDREPCSSFALYHLLKWPVVNPLLRLYFRGRVYGAHNVPKRGAFVAVSNHASNADPPLLSCAIGRPVAFMAKEELFRTPVFREAIQLYGAYPVRRAKADRQAIETALAMLDRGWGTGVFLSGTRTSDGRIGNPKTGAALLAARANVPLVPVSLWGTQHILRGGLPRPAAITIRIGQPIAPPESTSRPDLQRATALCAERITELHQIGR